MGYIIFVKPKRGQYYPLMYMYSQSEWNDFGESMFQELKNRGDYEDVKAFQIIVGTEHGMREVNG